MLCNISIVTLRFAAATILSLGAAHAATISGVPIITPTSIGEDDPTNKEIQGYNEIVGYTLLSDLRVDTNFIGGDDADGFISAGTVVDSHVLFLNSKGSKKISDRVTVTFSEKILGVMTDRRGAFMFASDDFLGGPVSYVPGGNYGNNRGLEGRDRITKIDDFSFTLFMEVTEPGDWIRVVTVSAVPLPAGALLLPVGLALMAGLRRRRKAAA